MIDYTSFCHYEEIVDYIPPKKDVIRGRIVGYLLLFLYIAFVGWGIKIIVQYGSVWLYIKYTVALIVIALILGLIFKIIHWIVSPQRPRLRAHYASVIKDVIGFDFGDDFKLLFTGSHDYEEYLYIFSEESFEPLKKHLESIPDGKDDKTGRVVNHVYKGQQGECFELVEDRRGGSVCGGVESIEVVPMQNLLLDLWGDDDFFNARSFQVFITRLRRSLSKDPRIRIVNVRGTGYKLIGE